MLDCLRLDMNCLTPIEVWPKNQKFIVPCGKCLICLSKKRNEWCFRLEQEYKRSKRAAFITLTYHPRFYPDTGVQKKHFQLFMKRLRKLKSNVKLRYYAVGEYGSKRQRAHYHAILFNWDGDEQLLSKAWSCQINGTSYPLGIVHIGRVNQASIRYTTKYVVQRGYLPHSPTGQKLNPPFALMSRGFGLGLNYLSDSMVAWHRSGDKNYAIVDGTKVALPRYYKKFIWPDEEKRRRVGSKAKWEAIRAHRKNMRELKAQGYEKPNEIIAEMRHAVLSRIKEKVAYTQTF